MHRVQVQSGDEAANAFRCLGGLHAVLDLLRVLNERPSLLVPLAAQLLACGYRGSPAGQRAVLNAGGLLLLVNALQRCANASLDAQSGPEQISDALAVLMEGYPAAQVCVSTCS